MTHEKIFENILIGQFDNLPEEKQKIVRIFFSSTFSGELPRLDYSSFIMKYFQIYPRYICGKRLPD